MKASQSYYKQVLSTTHVTYNKITDAMFVITSFQFRKRNTDLANRKCRLIQTK